MILHFCKDLVDALAIWSKYLQRTDQLLFDVKYSRDRMIRQFEKFIEKDGDKLKLFKSEVTCSGNLEGQPGHWAKTGCNEEEILSSPKVEWRGVELPPVSETDVMPELDLVRTPAIENLIDELSFYFPDNTTSTNFAIFNNLEFPTDKTLLESHGQAEIKQVANTFGLTEPTYQDELAREWKTTLQTMAGRADFCRLRKETPRKFWFHYLNEMQIPQKVYNLLVRSLALPSNTASIERGFSIMGQFRTKSRNRLLPAALDALIRVGWDPQHSVSLDKFPADYYSNKWKQTHKRIDDPAYQYYVNKMNSGGDLYEAPDNEREGDDEEF